MDAECRRPLALALLTLLLLDSLAPVLAQSQAADRCPPEVPADPNRRSTTATPGAFEPTPCDPQRLPPPAAATTPGAVLVPDRWRIVSALGNPENLLDPYHGNNWLKGDRPAFGADWFVSLTGVSDTLLEARRFPVPVGGPVTARQGSLDVFGEGAQWIATQTLLAELVVYKGDTVFKPPDYEFRFIPVFNVARVQARERGLVKANPDFGTSRIEAVLGIQGLFFDKHLRNVSEHYDFDAVRIGVQPFTTDFRGFLFNDSPLGLRLFGTRHNNRYQYNLGWFRRFDKDATTGLNDFAQRGLAALRKDDLIIANFYVQDWPRLAFTTQATVAHNINREGDRVQYDDHGVVQRPASLGLAQPRNYRVTYVGVSGDGHFARWNLTASGYFAFGREDHGVFTSLEQDIRAGFFAAELSRDFSWIRVRGSLLYASADANPFDDVSTGFDAINENPLFAGADTSFWIRQPVPLIGGGRVALSARNGLLNSLRASREYGQSNFSNPGTTLLGIGADLDLTPQLRVSLNINELGFVDTTVLEVARAQAGVKRRIGLDVSAAATWRPFATQNVVARLSAAILIPGAGYKALYGDELAYSVLGNLVLQY
jgi:hypothetical protein